MQWPAGFARFFDYESSSSSSSFSSCSNRVLFIKLFPVFTQCLCVLIYLRVQSEASQATPTYVNTPVASPIRGNGAEIMPARLWESARNNRGVAQIRAGRKMRREDGAKERREGEMGLYASTKWVMGLEQIYQLLHFRRRLGWVPRLR